MISIKYLRYWVHLHKHYLRDVIITTSIVTRRVVNIYRKIAVTTHSLLVNITYTDQWSKWYNMILLWHKLYRIRISHDYESVLLIHPWCVTLREFWSWTLINKILVKLYIIWKSIFIFYTKRKLKRFDTCSIKFNSTLCYNKDGLHIIAVSCTKRAAISVFTSILQVKQMKTNRTILRHWII